MKRLIFIVLLLGAALTLLYWIDKQIEEPLAPIPEPTPRVPPEPANETQGMQVGGPTLWTEYDKTTKRAAWILRSQDTATETDASSGATSDILSGVTLELFGPGPDSGAGKDVLQARFTAARAHLVRVPDQAPTQPRWEKIVRVEDVEVELLRGLALAPLTFHAPTAVVDLRQPLARSVTTDDAFTARSTDLQVEGRGLEGQLDLGTLEIRHAGKVVLNRARGAPATFTVRGDAPMQLRRLEGEHGPVVLETKDGAELEPGAENPGKLSAKHVVLRAQPDAAGELVIERLEADGAVDWTAGDSRFQGRTLAATFGAKARLEHARLEGEPSAELAIALTPGVLPSVQTKEERLVTIHGRDSLDITWRDDGYELVIEGPPEGGVPNLATQDFTLRSASRIDGWLAADQRSARFHAAGGVAITGGPATLETADFTVELAPDAQGQTVLTGTATGGSRLEGTLPSEADVTEPGESVPRVFTLVSPDGLKLERSVRGWRVIESTHVDVALEGPDGFTARADRVHDFVVPEAENGALEPGGLRFGAEGNVAVEFAAGIFGGESLEVLALEPVPHFVVRGTHESKAFFRGSYGEARALEVSALEIERTGDTLTLRGEVAGAGEFPDGRSGKDLRVSFRGDELVLDRAESPELLPGERLRTLRMTVLGHVQGSLSSDEQTLVVRSQRFAAENRVRLVEGKESVELGSLFIAEGSVHADVLDQKKKSDLTIDCERFEVERTQSDVAANFRQFIANGNVRFQGRFGEKSALDFGGEGEVFVYDGDSHGTLEAGPYGRVTLFGRSEEQMPFRLTATRLDFEPSDTEALRLFAEQPELRTLGLRARAEHLAADEQSGVVLSGGVRASGATAARMPFTLDADEVVLVGRLAGQDSDASAEDQIDSLTARGHVDFRLSEGLRARGERLSVRRATGLLRLDGAPATFEFGGARLETEWVEFDPVLQILVGTGRGRMLSPPLAAKPDNGDDWSVDFLSVSTLLELDSVVLVIQEPVFHTAHFESALRASWAILWLNREGFQDAERRDELLVGLQSALKRMQSLRQRPTEVLSIFHEAGISNLLREIYFEGPVEVLSEGELLARADAIYLDLASELGWLARATVNMGGQFMGQRQEKMIVKADWLRLSSEGELRADRATVTACSFDEPHVSVVTGNLSIKPIVEPGKAHYQLRLEDNRVELYGLLRVPLPTIDFATDEELQPILPTLSLANSARFGTLFSFGFTRPADAIGELFDKLARWGGKKDENEPAQGPTAPTPEKPRSRVNAHYKVDGAYLGSRGGLLDLGLEIESKQDYWFDLYVGLVGDTGADRGFVRVPEDERNALRSWIRSQAYFDHGKSALSFSYSDQSDAGVQAEFFEGQFLRYERSETYVQWRRSQEEYFVQATAKLRIDDFRTDIEELPSVSAYRGRSPLFTLGPLSLLHTGDARAEYLRRRVGTAPQSPFELPLSFDDTPDHGFGALDGLGEREALRADTSQGLELPVALGAGWKLTPFVSGRATAWSAGVEESDSPSRLLAEGGARLGATFWKRGANGKLHQLAPFAEYRSELARADDGGDPVVFDDVERVLSGDFLRFGTRGRFEADTEGSLIDIDLAATHASSRSDGRADGWLPLEVFGRLVLQPAGQEFELFHDGRYDLETKRTVYSLLSFGTHFGEEWGVQFSHQRGLDSDMQPLFEAASVSGLYRWTEKWEFEARQSFSLLENQRLDTRLGLRRYAHDLVFEFDTSFREGEGSSIGLSVRPRFGYHPQRIGYVPW
ncbi:MAG: hypothetical protein EXS08_05050 [Planctomycetes bacterium]|nr:hypothetical protein [Planctomycetota bacterium]